MCVDYCGRAALRVLALGPPWWLRAFDISTESLFVQGISDCRELGTCDARCDGVICGWRGVCGVRRPCAVGLATLWARGSG
eukprot:5782273-Prymnesium_polylepis.1